MPERKSGERGDAARTTQRHTARNDDDEFSYGDDFETEQTGRRQEGQRAVRGVGARPGAAGPAVRGSMQVADDGDEDDAEAHGDGPSGAGALDRSDYPSDGDIPGYKSLPVGRAGHAAAGEVGGGTGPGATGKGAAGGVVMSGGAMLGMDLGLSGGPPATAPGVLGIPPAKMAFDPVAEYSKLKVPEDIRELLAFISQFRPSPVELPTPLRPFVPDYIPALSEVDAFLKPSRPDGKPELLGLRVLDEPAAVQSDPPVLDLRLRALSKKAGVGLQPVSVRSIEHAEKAPKEISKWITSIEALHRSRPAPSVHYTRPMPDVDTLLQEWPQAFEAALRDVQLPGSDIDFSLEEYARLACALVDIPVYPPPTGGSGASSTSSAGAAGASGSSEAAGPVGGNQLVQALHVLFTLYHEFRSNPHFVALQGKGQTELHSSTA